MQFVEDSMRKQLAVATLALTLLWAGGASAAQILFNPDGGGAVGALSITALDPLPGNAIALGANANSAPGTDFDLRFQANLGVTTLNGVPNYLNGSNGNFFTFVAGFGETVATNAAGNLTFDFNAAEPNNFFYMYVNQTDFASDLSGTGFTAGAQILSGTVTGTDFSSGFNSADQQVGCPNVCPALDQSGANNYFGVQTLVGSGATSVTVTIDSFDASYFPDLVVGSTLLFANTSQVLPYNQTDPSNAFSSDGIANGDIPGVPSVGAINALGTNTMFQADANIAIEVAQQVPMPMSVVLLGVGLVSAAGLGVLRRSKR